MVRLEKVVYQQLVNSATLNRARKVSAPQKWNTTNPYEHMSLLGKDALDNSFFGRLIKPFLAKVYHWELSYYRDGLLQKGLTFEDCFLHSDPQLRRCVLFEHVARESLHPYHWILKTRRRQRYFKVQRGVKGFFVPEYLRNQAKQHTYNDYMKLRKEWTSFTHNNYWSDMTPSAHRTIIPRLFLLELPMNYGILRSEAWQRYFMNEVDDEWYSEKELKQRRNPKKFLHDLTTSQGKKLFQVEMTEVNAKHPGIVAIEGQQFDFKSYYNEIGV